MAIFLEYTQKNGKAKKKEFNSYYLAVVAKNDLKKKGISAKLYETQPVLNDKTCHDSGRHVQTIYSKEELEKLHKIRSRYMPELFPAPKKTLTK